MARRREELDRVRAEVAATNVIDVHVSRLRRKLEEGFDRPLLHTVRGAGYMLEA